MAQFRPAVDHLLRIEGGYVPEDVNNGAANYGITGSFLKSIGRPSRPADVANLTRFGVTDIYFEYFWRKYHCGLFCDQALAETLFFAVVNMAPFLPIKYIQRACNTLGASLVVDGKIGFKTISAVAEFPPETLAGALKSKLAKRYTYLASTWPETYAQYLNGWLARLDET